MIMKVCSDIKCNGISCNRFPMNFKTYPVFSSGRELFHLLRNLIIELGINMFSVWSYGYNENRLNEINIQNEKTY